MKFLIVTIVTCVQVRPDIRGEGSSEKNIQSYALTVKTESFWRPLHGVRKDRSASDVVRKTGNVPAPKRLKPRDRGSRRKRDTANTARGENAQAGPPVVSDSGHCDLGNIIGNIQKA